MKPAMDARGIRAASDQRALARFFIERFNETVQAIESPTNRFVVARTAGTLTAAEWVNEIHPTPDGFGKIAAKVARAMRPHL
jgi:hypothetical protein